MSAPLNGEEKPAQRVGLDVIQPFIEQHLNAIAGSLPDFSITFIARNLVQPGADLVLTIDDVDSVIAALTKAKAKLRGHRIIQ